MENIIKYNIVVIEQQDCDYEGVTTLHYDFAFNYHRCLNLGISQTKNPYIVLCNNDLVFEKDWAENLHEGFSMGYRSLSPYCKTWTRQWFPSGRYIIEGYTIKIHIVGWCIAVERNVIKEIGGLNEGVEFWYSDDIYGIQIKNLGIVHGMVCCSFVHHMTSKTLDTCNIHERVILTGLQKKKFDETLRTMGPLRKGS